MGKTTWYKILQRCFQQGYITKKECGIVNLDDHIGPGTHWVCYRNIDRFCEYFDSFGLPMPIEVKKYMKTSGKRLVYSTDEIQERDSVLCGYWCLYYLLERQKGRSILDTIHNCKFDMSDHVQVSIINSSSITSKIYNIYI